MANDRNTKAIQLRQNVEGRINKARAVIEPALPKGVDFNEMRAKAFLELHANKDIADATPISVFWGIVHATSLGLSVSKVNQEAHLVPFKDKGTEKAQLVIGYRGLLKLAYQHPKILDINVQAVFEDDEFEIELGSEPSIVFRPDLDAKREKVYAAFCVVTLLGKRDKTGKVMQVMSRHELEKVRDSSRGSKNPQGPWNLWFEEMCKKTVLRRTLKSVPRSSELDQALSIENSYEQEEPEIIGDYEEEPAPKPKGRVAKAREAVSQRARQVVTQDGEVLEGEMVDDATTDEDQF